MNFSAMKSLLLGLLFAIVSLSTSVSGFTPHGNVHLLNWSTAVGDAGVLDIDLGDSVTWVWTAEEQHTVTPISTPPGFTDSGVMYGSGSKFTVQFNEPGEFAYVCDLHEDSMYGVIVVSNETSHGTSAAARNVPRPGYATSGGRNMFYGALLLVGAVAIGFA